MKKLELTQIADPAMLENFKILQEFMDAATLTVERFRPIELFLKSNTERLKIAHGLGFVPLDIITTRLIAPSGAKLIYLYSEFTSTEIVISVTGLVGTLNARMLVGSFSKVVTINGQERESNETQELKCKL